MVKPFHPEIFYLKHCNNLLTKYRVYKKRIIKAQCRFNQVVNLFVLISFQKFDQYVFLNRFNIIYLFWMTSVPTKDSQLKHEKSIAPPSQLRWKM